MDLAPEHYFAMAACFLALSVGAVIFLNRGGRLIWRSGRILVHNGRFEVLVKEYSRECCIFLNIAATPNMEEDFFLYERLAPRAAADLSEALAEGIAKSRSGREK